MAALAEGDMLSSRYPNVSIWAKVARGLGRATAFPRFADAVAAGTSGPSQRYDTVVLGGGIVGISTALKLKELGQRVVLLEARNIGGGTTGW